MSPKTENRLWIFASFLIMFTFGYIVISVNNLVLFAATFIFAISLLCFYYLRPSDFFKHISIESHPPVGKSIFEDVDPDNVVCIGYWSGTPVYQFDQTHVGSYDGQNFYQFSMFQLEQFLTSCEREETNDSYLKNNVEMRHE